MRTRQEPLTSGQNANLFQLQIDGEQHHFEVPYPLDALDLLTLFDEAGLGDFAKGSREGGPLPAELLRKTKGLWTLGGAAVGLCWAHPELELEAELPDGEDAGRLVPYGRKVLQELHRAGYRPAFVTAVLPELLGKLSGSVVTGDKLQEASARADFSDPPEATGT